MMTAIQILTDDPSGRQFTASSFLTYLRRSNDHWWTDPGDHQHWMFRGHWNAEEWKLQPSAWRPNNNKLNALFEKLTRKVSSSALKSIQTITGHNGISDTELLWNYAEYEALLQFATTLNQLSYSVSERILELTQRRPILNFDRYAPPLSYVDEVRREIAPLAQHHGIPTRYLDWTASPETAAYFAVAPQYRYGSPKRLSVWALNLSRLQQFNMEIDDLNPTNPDFVRVWERRVPDHNHQYLRAQRGLFTEMVPSTGHRYYTRHDKWPDMEAITAIWEQLVNINDPILLKIMLPVEEAEELLMRLDREGINQYYLMPSLDNAAVSVVERWAR